MLATKDVTGYRNKNKNQQRKEEMEKEKNALKPSTPASAYLAPACYAGLVLY